jgi:RNA polymerase sigma-70 factor (ECF subfamily)
LNLDVARTAKHGDGAQEVSVNRRLVEAAQHGDREAFGQLVPLISDRLFGTAARLLRSPDAAGDVLQATLVSIWRELPALRDPDRFEAWASKVLLRRCYDELRRRRREAPAIELLAVDTPVPDAAVSIAARDQLERAFKRLSDDQRAVIVLRYYRDMSVAEIAEVIGGSEGTIKSRLHYAREALRAAVEADARPPIREGRPA